MKGSGKGKKGFLTIILSLGRILTIWGKMGAGKSNYAVILIEKLIGRFYYVFTNILFFDEDEIEEAKREELLDPNIDYLRLPDRVVPIRKKKSVTILDEASLFGAGAMAKEKKVQWLKQLATSVLRKLGSSLVIIAQDKNSVVPMLREELPSTEIRIVENKRTGERTENIFEIPDDYGITQEPRLVDVRRHVPQAVYPFDSHAPAKFEFDLDFEKFLNMAGEYTSLKLRKELPRIVEELVADYNQEKIKEKKVTKKDIVQLILTNDSSIEFSDVKKTFNTLGMEIDKHYFGSLKSELGISR